MSAKAIEAVTAHFKGLGTKFVDVPEWQIDGKPLRIFYKPLTPFESQAIFGDGNKGAEAFVDAVVEKALDEDGKKLFGVGDRVTLRRNAHDTVVRRVAMEMLAAHTIEEMEKNSAAIPA